MPRCLICGSDHAVCTGPTGPQVLSYPPVGAFMENQATMPKVNGPYTATERLYLDAQGKVVREDNPDKVSLLIAPGQTLPAERAAELGLMDAESGDAIEPAKPRATSKAKAAPAENKAVAAPKETK